MRPNDRCGSFAPFWPCLDVRFAPNIDGMADIRKRSKRATSGLMQCNKTALTQSSVGGGDRRCAGKPLPSATAFSRVSARYCVPADKPRPSRSPCSRCCDGSLKAGITWCHMFHSSPARRKPSIIFCRSLSRVNRTDSAIHLREMSG